MSKKILGLDLGTNSIGWALIKQNFEEKQGEILGMGSRIIPMTQDIKDEFGKGNSISQTAERTFYRGVRRLRERHLLRRERLHRVLNVMGFLPNHYVDQIDFDIRLGKFLSNTEPKLPYNNNEFLFKNSFIEMVEDFKKYQPELLAQNKKIPYDWTIYYLRKKALTHKIEKEELAWLILNFNRKRGYYQLRGEEDENTNNLNEFVLPLKVVRIEKGDKDRKNYTRNWYKISLENGWEYAATFTAEPQWLNITKEFLITEELDENGEIKIVRDRRNDNEGREKRRITPLPTFEEIDLMSKSEQDKIYKKIKAKTEITITNSNKTVGSYIYDTLLQNPKQKINGKLVRTIERKFYKEELQEILQTQIKFHAELQDADLYNDCVRELYRNNEAQQIALSKKDFAHLFLDDIIFYQRPLRSKKSSISNCSLEYRKYIDTVGVEQKEYLKVIPKSNPYYQEFRIWQWLYNLRILKRDEDSDVTQEFIQNQKDLEILFAFLYSQNEVNHKDILNFFIAPKIKEKFPNAKPKELKSQIEKEIAKYRWNYVFDDSKDKEDDKSKKYPMNETGYEMRRRLNKMEKISMDFFTPEVEYQLWHLIYSVTDKIEFEKALKTFAIKYQLGVNNFLENFKKFPPFKSDFGAYSEKAIKKLLPLIRLGKYWNENDIKENVPKYQDNIHTLLENLQKREEKFVELDNKFKKTINYTFQTKLKQFEDGNLDAYQGLELHLASYLVYGKADLRGKWNSVADLEKYLQEFKQHSLRNPIVEQVITETLRVVKDIWVKYGNGANDFFDEIHIELGREMKNTADERKRLTNMVSDNEATNLRIKLLLTELRDNSDNKLVVEQVRPFSPMQQDALKIYEDGVLNSDIEIPDDILKISKTAQPTQSELQRYKLWLEQKYRSPYTGQIIPLSKLFTHEYEIEHIIPQSRYFDDSFSNKVICESAVNKLKDNHLGLEFIKNFSGEIVQDGNSQFKILTEEAYKEFLNQHYSKNRGKKNKLLLEEIPEKMIERQLNDTRYISKFISKVLSNIVRADENDDGINSKNVLPGNGRITTILKQDWGLNDVWNDLILPRFERMNQLTNSSAFTTWNQNHQKFLPTVPIELSKGFQKKRIDHRHHAMDALVIACATRDHINLLNNEFAKSNKRFDLNRKLRKFENVSYLNPQTGERTEKDVPKDFIKPWNNFTVDAKTKLENIVVSFKQNLRVINKTTNKHEKFVEKNGKMVKELVVQTKGDSWAIRKPMHKDTVSGKVVLPRIKVPKGKILTATRKSLDTSFDTKKIESITDTGIQKILINYLKSKNNNPELAFSPEGIDDLNQNIRQYNDGKNHQPIYKVRVFEPGSKFSLGQKGNKNSKFVEAAKGTNLFFAIYQDESGKRNYDTIPLNVVIERQKQGLSSVPETKEKGDRFLFHLSPNDLVYVSNEEDKEQDLEIDNLHLGKEQLNNLYKIVSFTGTRLSVIPINVATAIANKLEFTTSNKIELTVEKEKIIKLNNDRLGNISNLK